MEFEAFTGVGKDEDQNIGKFITPAIKKVIVGNIGPSSYSEVVSYGCKVYLCRNMPVPEAIKKVKNSDIPILKEPTLKESIHSAQKTGYNFGWHGKGTGTGRKSRGKRNFIQLFQKGKGMGSGKGHGNIS